MAISRRGSSLPSSIDASLRGYLTQRDGGEPSAAPSIIEVSGVAFGDMRVDTVRWTYSQIVPDFGLQADGFVLRHHYGETSEPSDNAVLVPLTQRAAKVVVPKTQKITYGLAAFRETHSGIEITRQSLAVAEGL